MVGGFVREAVGGNEPALPLLSVENTIDLASSGPICDHASTHSRLERSGEESDRCAEIQCMAGHPFRPCQAMPGGQVRESNCF